MKTTMLISLMVCVCHVTVHAQAVYVDSNIGDDTNPGTQEAPVFSIEKAADMIRSGDNDIYTMKINPGIYVLDSHVPIATKKDLTDKRIIIEASVLPDDPSWTPEKMPVIASKAIKGDMPINDNFVVGFLIDESHVTIRGIKFHGYFYPHARYFPVARFNKTKTDLLVEQCMFVGDANISQIQAGVIGHGNELQVDHCVFYKVRNTVVFFLDSGNGIKNGNGLTHSIIYGASQAVWTVSPDNDFKFKNNIVSNCRYVWGKRNFNTTKYSITNCVIVNNKYYTGLADNVRLSPGEFEINENNVIKEGKISLRLTGNDDKPALDSVDKPLPIDYMHIIPGTLGYEMGAGIFKHRRQSASMSTGSTQVEFTWGKQLGSDRDERTRNLVMDSLNNVYIFGKTNGNVGKESFGKYDGFIVKMDSAAHTLWSKQIGSKEEDDLFNSATDELGNLYVTGYIGTDVQDSSTPNRDILVVKLNSSGDVIWQRQYGTDSPDNGAGIAVNADGEIYVIGSTEGAMDGVSQGKTDCFILHLDNQGNQLHVAQLGTAADEQGYGITIGRDGNVYVCGTTEGDLAAKNAGNSDIFWAVYSKDLKQQTIKQFGTETYDCAVLIQTDDKNNVYVAGSTDWVLALALKQKMNGDCFLQKWNTQGQLCWEEQFGTDNWDGINGLAVIADKGVIVSGCQNNPMCQSFCRMYNEDGTFLWCQDFVAQGGRGTCGKGVCVNQQGDIYHAGYTGANLFSELKGGHDVFVIKLKADMK